MEFFHVLTIPYKKDFQRNLSSLSLCLAATSERALELMIYKKTKAPHHYGAIAQRSDAGLN